MALALALASCTPTPPPGAVEPSRATPPVSRAAETAANEQPTAPPRAPEVFPGTGVLVSTPGTARPARVVASDGGISFNFANADVRDVVREILGEQLHLDYVVDAKVQGTITAQTGAPVPREAVLSTFEGILRANGLALVHSGDLYRVLPIEDAAKAGGAPGAEGGPGFATRVLPLRYASAPALKSVLDPFVPPGGLLQADAARNVLIISGAGTDLSGFADLVRQFDVDWLAGTSFALYTLRVGIAKDIANELEPIFGEGGNAPVAGLVRIVPIERLNALLVISPQRGYLAQVKTWIDRLDYGDDQTTPRLFEYRVQNSRAADLAAVLTQLLSSGNVSTVQPETAPGSKLVELGGQTPGGAGGLPSAAGVGGGGLPGGVGGAAGGLGAPSTALPTPQTPQTLNAPGSRQGGAQGRQALNAALKPAAGGGGAGGPGELALPPVHIVADEKNNALVIFARPRDYKMIEAMIQRLDIVPLQVLIEATIAEVTLNDNLQFGLQWFFSKASSKFELNQGTTGINTAADIVAGFPGFNYVLGGGKAKVVLSALSEITHVDVVSAPHLLVLDHQTAGLQVGDQVPIVTESAQSVIAAGAPLVNSVQYLNTGVVLQVTPRVNSSGLISLDIDQQVSQPVSTTSSTIQSPTISQRRIVTSVVVQDGETIALGGLILDNQSNTRSGIPVLSNIPVVGSLFRTDDRKFGRTELLVLLSPRIVRNAKEARDMTDDLRDRMRLVKPLEPRAR
ncbi:MAG TPA: type II secretion system secretin GspD [Stellaceae bacterium]|nr:type II secretion system secretin GspD [Stellaceae bacterium]